uniref:Uncharacterized protein n=1 Tax=Arundo donax TaxID=35708 RepID=A0A0A9DM73_ARUDO
MRKLNSKSYKKIISLLSFEMRFTLFLSHLPGTILQH